MYINQLLRLDDNDPEPPVQKHFDFQNCKQNPQPETEILCYEQRLTLSRYSETYKHSSKFKNENENVVNLPIFSLLLPFGGR